MLSNQDLKLVDSVNGKTSPYDRAYSIQTDVWLSLHTRYAQLLVRGRQVKGKPPIIGLLRFADSLRVIWHAAEANDPYADWWLIKLQDTYHVIGNRIANLMAKFLAKLPARETFQIAPPEDKDPFRIRLSFATPYAYQAAELLSKFDSLVRCVLGCKHLGVIDNKTAKNTIYHVARLIRGLFALATRYRHLGIDRNNPLSFEADGKTARRYMGELPEDVREGTRRARLAPAIIKGIPPYVPPVTENNEAYEGLGD